MSTPRTETTGSDRSPAATARPAPRTIPVPGPSPTAAAAAATAPASSAPLRSAPSTFVDDPGGSPRRDGESFLRLTRMSDDGPGCSLRAEVWTDRFAGRSSARFRADDLAEFVEDAHEFAVGQRDAAALQGGTWDDNGNLTAVLVGIHVYRPGADRRRAAVRIVLSSPSSDDLLTTTLRSEPVHVAQFADAIAAVIDDARDRVTLCAH